MSEGIPSRAQNSTNNPESSVVEIITIPFKGYYIWLLAGSLFSMAGGILSLYAETKTNECHYKVQIAAVVIQSLAVICPLISIIIVFFKRRNHKKKKEGNAYVNFFGQTLEIKKLVPGRFEYVESTIILLINIACLIFILIIISTQGGCIHFGLNATYNIISVTGGFILSCIETWKQLYSINKKESPKLQIPQNNQNLASHPPPHAAYHKLNN